jgi:NAD dependent epimerase/dehydratase family enzyme
VTGLLGAREARLVLLRQSLVLAREGGTIAGLLPVYRLGLGGTLGSGRQWLSWIHLNDAARLIVHALDETRIAGPLTSARRPLGRRTGAWFSLDAGPNGEKESPP